MRITDQKFILEGIKRMAEHIMNGAELASMLKGQLGNQMNFNGLFGEDAEDLHLSDDEICWWRDAKFGLFIHWGIYSVIGKGEWAYFNEKIAEDTYRKIAEEEFHPERSAKEIVEEWIDVAESAGMKYAVMVTRHHDGFALWDSKGSYKNFTSMQCGQNADYVKAFTDICHERGIHTGLYYSPMDWRFSGYFDPKGQPESAALMKKQAYDQVEELCTQYGKVEILWYDGGWLSHQGTDADAAWLWEPLKLNRMARSYQPGIMVTPRSGYRGDFETDEGVHEVQGKIVPIPWEKCMSVSETWGYRPHDKFQDFPFLLRMLINTVCRDGNLLLNVGPDCEGCIPEEAKKVLKQMGTWLAENGEAIYATRGGVWQPVDGVYGCTYTDNAIYVHILDCNTFQNMTLPAKEMPKNMAIRKAAFLNGIEVPFEQTIEGVKILIPDAVQRENRLDTIVKLFI